MAQEGVTWLVFIAALGFEYWVLEVAWEMKEDYGFQLATIFDFEPFMEVIEMKLQLKIKLSSPNKLILQNMPIQSMKHKDNYEISTFSTRAFGWIWPFYDEENEIVAHTFLSNDENQRKLFLQEG